MAKKQLKGEIISDKMEKTAVVKVKRMFFHKKYKKRYFLSKKYKAQNNNNKYKEGDEVIIEGASPLSRTKRWVIVGKAKNTKK
jgi:small subunit ribosomal protein S17